MTDLTRVSVVIPSFGRPAILDRCVCSVLNSYHDDIELIIVDSPREGRYASTHIKVQDPRVTVMRLARRASTSRARNLGYMASSGECIFFLDNDNILGRETIPQLVDILKDPSIGVAGPITYYLSNPKIVWNAGTYKSRFFRLHKRYSFAHGYPLLYDAEIIPNAFMTKRKILDDVGLFDSRNFTIQEEESDWQWSCRERGLRTVICSSAATFHDIPISGSSHFSPETIQESFKSRFWIERKHKVGNILGFAFSSIGLSLYYGLRFRHCTESRLGSSNPVLVAIARGVMAGMFGRMRVAPEKAIQVG